MMLLHIFSNELKTYVHTKTYLWMSIAALFIIFKSRGQLRSLSIDHLINKLACPKNQTVMLKRNELKT